MKFTPEDLNREACWLEGDGREEVAAMLRAGADAMEREEQARNQALDEAAQVADKRVNEMPCASAVAIGAMLRSLPDAIRALKEKTE